MDMPSLARTAFYDKTTLVRLNRLTNHNHNGAIAGNGGDKKAGYVR